MFIINKLNALLEGVVTRLRKIHVFVVDLVNKSFFLSTSNFCKFLL